MTLSEILERAHKANVLKELKAELAKVLGTAGSIAPPRGWAAGELLLWSSLPSPVQEVISRRRDQDTKELRRLQNEVALLRKSFTPSRSSAPIKEETTHA
jgi:hypothetical protein